MADELLTAFPLLIYPLLAACAVYALVVLWVLSKLLKRLEYGDVVLRDLGVRLKDVLLSALALSDLDKYGTPNEAFKRLAIVYRPCVV